MLELDLMASGKVNREMGTVAKKITNIRLKTSSSKGAIGINKMKKRKKENALFF